MLMTTKNDVRSYLLRKTTWINIQRKSLKKEKNFFLMFKG